MTWGNPDYGGDSSEVQNQKSKISSAILAVSSRLWRFSPSNWQATGRAFAAILADGSLVTWGDPDYGGDSSEVQDQLKGVQQIQATYSAFAAILADGSVVTWGDPDSGGDSSEVQDQLKGVQQIQATYQRICCDPGGWVACDLGRSRLWR